ncbi:MAG: ATP-dependent DNA helicase RecG [Patescibacteria group bacterium]|nr:ATP-dependent DNA helicase RecG [Patescibacteria group bacterium]
MNLQTLIKDVSRTYKMHASRLEKLGIRKLEDFLYHFPSRYEDYSLISKISQIQPGETVTIQGKIAEIKNEYTKNFKKIQKAIIEDETGRLNIIWFNQSYLTQVIHKGQKISVAGEVFFDLGTLIIKSPEYEPIIDNLPTIHTGRIVPVYPETNGISSKWLRRQIYKILQNSKQNLLEYIPDSILKSNDLISFNEAIEQIHFPKNKEYALTARKRLSFDELLFLQLTSLKRKQKWMENSAGHALSIAEYKKDIQDFRKKLPFELTEDQKRAVSQIFKDLSGKKPMNRLLEGDVGSGKTVVSAVAMYLAYLNGCQSVLMAPTEILASQHHKTISGLLSPFGIKVGLLTGENKIKNQEQESKIRNSKSAIGDSSLDVVVGTHALLSKKINFEKLGLVVIDEQQRFGVEQRAIIRSKGKNPHLLTMTATPIPRTVALTLYGDLDLSYLDEMPKGRKTIKTWLVPKEKRKNAYRWIKSQIRTHKTQAFIICPFIEESESMLSVKAVTKEYQKLKSEDFSELRMGLLHGKLKAKEKEAILQKFKNKEFDILVATPIVEVGIDIANATIIMIEGSERFGLAQLHQLRGRVGRGEKQSFCLLFTESKSKETLLRLKAMETRKIGKELAELDLKLRGPGELYGTMQHGVKLLKIAGFSDLELIEKTRKAGEAILPQISSYPVLLKKLEVLNQRLVSPD